MEFNVKSNETQQEVQWESNKRIVQDRLWSTSKDGQCADDLSSDRCPLDKCLLFGYRCTSGCTGSLSELRYFMVIDFFSLENYTLGVFWSKFRSRFHIPNSVQKTSNKK